jgi:hypothetical protein
MIISIPNDDEPLEIASYDDFYYFRDSVHDALEEGDFGSRFPIFLRRFEPDEWSAEELDGLERELETIAEAFTRLPPRPFDSHWPSRVARSSAPPATLYDVFVDVNGEPLLGRLITLCRRARKTKRPIQLR